MFRQSAFESKRDGWKKIPDDQFASSQLCRGRREPRENRHRRRNTTRELSAPDRRHSFGVLKDDLDGFVLITMAKVLGLVAFRSVDQPA